MIAPCEHAYGITWGPYFACLDCDHSTIPAQGIPPAGDALPGCPPRPLVVVPAGTYDRRRAQLDRLSARLFGNGVPRA